jgi:hypothetical protein
MVLSPFLPRTPARQGENEPWYCYGLGQGCTGRDGRFRSGRFRAISGAGQARRSAPDRRQIGPGSAPDLGQARAPKPRLARPKTRPTARPRELAILPLAIPLARCDSERMFYPPAPRLRAGRHPAPASPPSATAEQREAKNKKLTSGKLGADLRGAWNRLAAGESEVAESRRDVVPYAHSHEALLLQQRAHGG